MRFFCAWLVLFGSKFVILEALSLAFRENVKFEGVLHGIVWLIIVVITMVIAEEIDRSDLPQAGLAFLQYVHRRQRHRFGCGADHSLCVRCPEGRMQ